MKSFNHAKYEKRQLGKGWTRVLNLVLGGLMLSFLAFVVSCNTGFVTGQNEGRVSLRLESGALGRTWLPGIDANVSQYELTLTQGETVLTETLDSQSTSWESPALSAGAWTLEIQGMNTLGTIITEASESFTLNDGELKEISLVLSPVAGNGNLLIQADLTSAAMSSASLEISLADASQSPVTLPALVLANGIYSLESPLASGYYYLTLTLKEGSSTVDTLRGILQIIAGAETSLGIGVQADAALLLWDVEITDGGDDNGGDDGGDGDDNGGDDGGDGDDNGGNVDWETPSSFYATNPNGQVGVYNANMTVSNTQMKSEGFTDWTEDMIIAQGVANDIAQSFRGSHEAPIYDTYTLYAAWDDTNLYLGWQFVNVVDVTDPAQGYPISDNGKPWNGDIPQVLAFDVDPNLSSDGALADGTGVWAAPGTVFNTFQNGMDRLLMFSSKPGVGQPAIFTPTAAGTMSYEDEYVNLFTTAGVVYGYIDGLHPSNSSIWGVNKPGAWAGYSPEDLLDPTQFVDMLTLGHASSQDTFYEMMIPFEALGIDRNYLETTGIGVMHISTFGESAIGSIPYDPTVFDNYDTPYGPDSSSSGEKEDLDVFTAPMARIGRL